MNKQSILVCGGGVAGLILAHALSKLSVDITLVEPFPPKAKFKTEAKKFASRTAVIMNNNLNWLCAHDIWSEEMDALTCPMEALEIIDMGDNDPAPSVKFLAKDAGAKAFGRNTPLIAYRAYLWEHLPKSVKKVKEVKGRDNYDLVIATDGRHSPTRETTTIQAHFKDTGKSALTFAIKHRHMHNNVSTEVQRVAGPVTLVPLPDPHMSAVVMTDDAKEIIKFEAQPETIPTHLEKLFSSVKPDEQFEIMTGLNKIDLSFMHVDRLYEGNVLLMAEAAHVLHPLGAQGLNLSIGDAIAIEKLVSKALNTGQSVNDQMHVMNAYQKERSAAHAIRQFAVQSSLALLENNHMTKPLRRGVLGILRKVPALRQTLVSTQKSALS